MGPWYDRWLPETFQSLTVPPRRVVLHGATLPSFWTFLRLSSTSHGVASREVYLLRTRNFRETLLTLKKPSWPHPPWLGRSVTKVSTCHFPPRLSTLQTSALGGAATGPISKRPTWTTGLCELSLNPWTELVACTELQMARKLISRFLLKPAMDLTTRGLTSSSTLAVGFSDRALREVGKYEPLADPWYTTHPNLRVITTFISHNQPHYLQWDFDSIFKKLRMNQSLDHGTALSKVNKMLLYLAAQLGLQLSDKTEAYMAKSFFSCNAANKSN